MVAINRFHGCIKLHTQAYLHGLNNPSHHHLAINAGKLLGPFHRFHILIEMVSAFGQIRQVFVGQVNVPFFHILFCQLDKVGANAIPHSSGSAVQHHPNRFCFIQADFDKVVTGTQGSQMIYVVGVFQHRMLFL